MDFKEGLLTRRSVRQYKPNIKVPKSDIEDILKTAMHAPSAKNMQSWEFIIIQEDDMLAKIKKNLQYTTHICEAGNAILVCGDMSGAYKPEYNYTDTSAATMNILYACHEKGLGACWCGVFPVEEYMDLFSKEYHLPENIKPISLVVFGYPLNSEAKQPSNRFKLKKIHWDKW